MCMFLQQVVSYCSWSDNNKHLFMIGLLRYPMPHKIGSAFLWAFHLLAMFEVLLGIDTVTQTLRQVNMSRSCKLLQSIASNNSNYNINTNTTNYSVSFPVLASQESGHDLQWSGLLPCCCRDDQSGSVGQVAWRHYYSAGCPLHFIW
jgi:hypothetical protein